MMASWPGLSWPSTVLILRDAIEFQSGYICFLRLVPLDCFMSKRSPQAGPKPPRKCIFCGEGGKSGNPMSEEHLWSEWMAPLLPKNKGTRYVEYAESFRATQPAGPKLLRDRQGGAIDKRYKVVCKRCNETWMSAMEMAVRPRLIPLIKGEPILLGECDRQMLADWIMLKAFVVEHTSYRDFPAEPISSQQDREYFMLLRQLPFGVRIWIAQHTSPEKWRSAVFGHNFGAAPPHGPLPPPPRPKNTQIITLGIGALLVHIFWTTSATLYSWIKFEGLVPPFRELWPMTKDDIRWRPLLTISEYDIEKLVQSSDAFVAGPHVQFVDD